MTARKPVHSVIFYWILALAIGVPALVSILAMSGCATVSDDVLKAQANARAEAAKAEQARYTMMSLVAPRLDPGGAGASMALMSQSSRALGQTATVLQSRHWADYIMQALGLAVQVHGINSGRDVAIAQSNNSRDVSVASYEALSETAGLIQSPQANMTYTASGDGASTGGAGSWHWEQVGPDSNNTTSGDTIDNTSTPTVVNPVVVTP